jgi:hypothetical protein
MFASGESLFCQTARAMLHGTLLTCSICRGDFAKTYLLHHFVSFCDCGVGISVIACFLGSTSLLFPCREALLCLRSVYGQALASRTSRHSSGSITPPPHPFPSLSPPLLLSVSVSVSVSLSFSLSLSLSLSASQTLALSLCYVSPLNKHSRF